MDGDRPPPRSWLEELKRRNVFRVAIAYAAVAFVLVQATDYIFDALLFPPWAHRLFVVFVLLGFPIALLLAWAFELTPEGVERTRAAGSAGGEGVGLAAGAAGDRARGSTPPPTPAERPFRGAKRSLAVIAVGAAIGLLAYQLFGPEPSPASGGSARIGSVAVLPFSDLSPEGDQGWFSDGIAEEIMGALRRVADLRVAARSSSFRFRNRELGASAIGDSLGVDAFLEGSVRKAGSRVRISAELVDTSNGYQIWSTTLERPLEDIFALQEEIARSVVGALELRVGEDLDRRLADRPTESLDAYAAYLEGRHAWNRRTPDGMRRSLDLFEKALSMDSTFAEAWAGLADAYTLLGSYGMMSPGESFPKAHAAATRAIELDDGLAEAHTSLAATYRDYFWEWGRAEAEFLRALELDPNYATAHYWYAGLLTDLGRFEPALYHARRAEELDPLSLLADTYVGRAHYFQHRYETAIRELRAVLDRGPDPTAFLYLGLAYSKAGEHGKAIATLQEAAKRYEGLSAVSGLLGYVCARGGREERARELMSGLEERHEAGRASAVDIAAVHVGLGQTDQALEWLERAYREKNWQMAFLGAEPLFDPLRDDPRFVSLVERLGLS